MPNPFALERAAAALASDALVAACRPLTWADFSLASTLFQDSSRTVAVASNNDPIGGVTDRGGFGNHWTAASNPVRPLWKTNTKNGLAVAESDGTDDRLLCAGLASKLGGSIVIFVVYRQLTANANGSDKRLFGNINASSLSGFATYGNATNSSTGQNMIGVRDSSGTSRDISSSSQLTSSSWYIQIYALRSNRSLMRVNGQQVGSNLGANKSTSNSLALFNDGSSSTFFLSAQVGEFIVCPNISDNMITQVELALNSKWSIY